MVGTRIKQRREELGMTQARLAEIIGISRVTMGKIENHETQTMTTDVAVKLADALGVSMDYLLCGRC